MTNVTIGRNLATIEDWAFIGCSNLAGVYFHGNAPTLLGTNVFYGDNSTVYYLPGTVGWGTTFGGRPTVPWRLPYPVILSSPPNLGIKSDAFGFRVSWVTNASVVIETSTDATGSVWQPLRTNTLANGWVDFSDQDWPTYPRRFYRARAL